jgi:coenzyme PQQ biosynthesis protein PqqD
MSNLHAKPRLNSKARLRVDRRTGETLLLFPERGLALNRPASEIVRLCTGKHTVDEIIGQLTAQYGNTSSGEIARGVCGLLDALSDRGLLWMDT